MFSMSWTIGVGAVYGGGNQYRVTLNDVLKILEEIFQKSGSVCLEITDAPDIGPQSLQVHAENNNFILLLLEHDEDDSLVKTYTNSLDYSGQVEILGNFWDSRSICTDSRIIVNVFTEFYSTGGSSGDLLS